MHDHFEVRRSMLKASLGLPLAGVFPARAFAQQQTPLTIRRLTWAGVRLDAGDTSAYIDAVAPIQSDDASNLNASTSNARRYALITHGHGDHFDIDYLRGLLGENGVIFCHRQVLGEIDARSLRVQAVEHWEPVFMPRSGANMVAFAVPAVDGFGSFQTSWVIRSGRKRLIHCGDTLWHGEWFDIVAALGPFDVALLPINGARQTAGRFRDLDAPGVLTPELAVAAARALEARIVIPIHYGRDDPASGYSETTRPLSTFLEEARRHGVATRVLAPGESLAV
jgi:L-ascorbate metabolism protein UlaG (beta-lactamase superfamily)